MSTRLRAARLASKKSQTAVVRELVSRASSAGIYVASASSLKTLLSMWENGKRPVPAEYRAIFRAVYGRTDDELFGSPNHGRDAGEYTKLAQRIASARTIDHESVAALTEQTNLLRRMDLKVGAPTLVDQMSAHLSTLASAMRHVFLPRYREPIAEVLADAAALAGWQALDVGAVDRAWEHHETARRAALECRNTALLSHAMGQQALALVDVEEHAAAVELATAARAAAGRSSAARLLAWLWATEAEVLAAAGEEHECRRALDSATDALPAGSSPVDEDMPYIVLNESHLRRWRGNILARLGDNDAVEELYQALAGIDSTTSTRAEASLRCDLAHAHAVRGEPDEAGVHAAEARRLAKRAGSVRQQRRLHLLASRT